MCKVVAYYRVSTEGQGRSGLGLDAQKQAVLSLCESRGWHVIEPSFTEIESGKRNDRPELEAALERCRLTGAKLVVAKLDRLSRNAAFTLQLRDSGVEFTCADNPDVNRLTVGILALVAEQEREAISDRTKKALAAAKVRGTWTKADGTPYKSGNRLGNPNGAAAFRRAGKGNAASRQAAVANADAFAEGLRATINKIRSSGPLSMQRIADALNAKHIKTPRDGKWAAGNVQRLLARLDLLAEPHC
jgi:DNA invertase Pin-like site-specific DNA recombinase